MLSLNAESCELFNIPFYQFAQMKKFCPEDIPAIKADYKLHWDNWKAIIQEVAKQLGTPFAKPHIESWTNWLASTRVISSLILNMSSTKILQQSFSVLLKSVAD